MIWLWLPGSLWVVTLVAGFVLHRPARRPLPPQADYVKISRLEQQLGIGPVPPGSEFGLDELGFPVFKQKPPPPEPPPSLVQDVGRAFSDTIKAATGGTQYVNQTYNTVWCRQCGHSTGHASWCSRAPKPPPPMLAKPDHRCSLCIPGRPATNCPFNSVCQT